MITCACNPSVSDKNKPGLTSQKIMEFLQWKTLLDSFSTLCSLLPRSSSHIAAIQGKDRCTWTCWLLNVIPDVLCFLTNDYYKIIDMFLDHAPWVGKPINSPFSSKGQIRCQRAFLNSRTKTCVSNPCYKYGIVHMLYLHCSVSVLMIFLSKMFCGLQMLNAR